MITNKQIINKLMKYEKIIKTISKFIEPFNKRVIEFAPPQGYINGTFLYHFNNDEKGTDLNYDKGYLISLDAICYELRISKKRLPLGNIDEPKWKGTVEDIIFRKKLNKLTSKELEKALSTINFN